MNWRNRLLLSSLANPGITNKIWMIASSQSRWLEAPVNIYMGVNRFSLIPCTNCTICKLRVTVNIWILIKLLLPGSRINLQHSCAMLWYIKASIPHCPFKAVILEMLNNLKHHANSHLFLHISEKQWKQEAIEWTSIFGVESRGPPPTNP